MNNFQHQKLYNTLNKKDSTELLEIWELNNRLAWSEEAFQVVKQILQERQITHPEQSSQAHKPTEVPSKKHPSKTKNTLVPLKYAIAELRKRYSYLIAYIFYISLTTVSAWLLSFFSLPIFLHILLVVIINYGIFIIAVQRHILPYE